MKILIVEDSATLRHIMCRHISNAGHTPIVAENGETALQLIDTRNIDMVIMDVEMPGLDGFETTRLIREWFGDFWIPIIFVTGKNEERDLRQGIDAGGDDYLIKPISETILIAKIRAMQRITEMRDQLNKLNQELTELSERDSLTRLYNRRTFEQRAQEQWRLATRTREPLSVLLMDIDHFKPYNDSYGHIAGDECIIKVANSISESLSRPGDLVARFGGEEFIAILPNTCEDGAYHVAERIRTDIERLNIQHRKSPTHDRITVSIGGAVVNQTPGAHLLDQINAADKALYAAKESGRNRVIVKLFSPRTLILVASTDANLVRAIDGRLMNHCTVMHARDGDQALEMASSNRPDIILIDLALPTEGGIATAWRIRNEPSTAHIPFILTGKDCLKTLLTKGNCIEVEACLEEPVSQPALVDKLNEMLF